MEAGYKNMRVEKVVLKKLQKQQQVMRKSAVGDVLYSIVKLLDEQKSWGELR